MDGVTCVRTVSPIPHFSKWSNHVALKRIKDGILQ